MKTITNNHTRNFLYGSELTKKELKDFDWMDDPSSTDGFIRYRGIVYHLSEFIVSNEPNSANGWHGIHSDTAFSGVGIRVSDDCETYQIALLLS